MKDVIIISGPTAVGKTKLALELAKNLNTEIISCDSMQIYRGMDIGTAKIKENEMEGIKHYLIDIIEPTENYSVQEFQNQALQIINKLHFENKIPIVVGGTGLYVDSLTHNFDFLKVKPDFKLRKNLELIYEKDPNELLNILKKIDNKHYSMLGIKDKKKIIRAIEVFEKSGKLIDYSRANNNEDINYHLFVLNDDRNKLYERINYRVDQMIEKGLVDEVKGLINKGVDKNSQSMKAIGYKEVIEYLEKNLTFDEMVDKIKKNSRNYAKRQLTWFRRNEYTNWIDISNNTFNEIIDMILNDLE